MDQPELERVYQPEIWREILPDVLVGFGVIIPLLLSGAWLAAKGKSDGQSPSLRFDIVAALALLAWLGYFVGQRLVFMMEHPDEWAILCLVGAAFSALWLLLLGAGSETASSCRGSFQPDSPGLNRLREKSSKFFAEHPDLKFVLHCMFVFVPVRIWEAVRRIGPHMVRGLAVFCLASSTSTYSFLLSQSKMVITIEPETGRGEQPSVRTCYIAAIGDDAFTQEQSIAGLTLPYRVALGEQGEKRLVFWCSREVSSLIGSDKWSLVLTFDDPDDAASSPTINIDLNSLVSEVQGWLNTVVYRKNVKLGNTTY